MSIAGRPPRGWLRVVAALWLGFAASPVWAQEPATGPVRVAFVDMERLLREAPQMRDLRAALQAELADRKRDLEAEAASIEELKRKRDEPGQPDAEVAILDRRIAAAERGLKRARTELDELRAVRSNEAVDAIDKLVGEAAAAAARERGFAAVMTREYAVYVDPALDLTEAVLARLRQAQPAPVMP